MGHVKYQNPGGGEGGGGGMGGTNLIFLELCVSPTIILKNLVTFPRITLCPSNVSPKNCKVQKVIFSVFLQVLLIESSGLISRIGLRVSTPPPTKLVGNKAAFEPEITLLQYFDNIEKGGGPIPSYVTGGKKHCSF